jgi:transposase InsO family protein
MSPHAVREYLDALRPRYGLAKKPRKTRLLNEAERITGYNRKAIVRLLNRRLSVPRHRRGRPRRYGKPIERTLQQLWVASGHLCSKRLGPFLPELLSALERHGELRVPPRVRHALLTVSPATIDRLLKPHRRHHLRRPLILNPATAALRSQIPLRTFGDWQHVRPGAVQADLVAHCGETTAGFYLHTLIAVDVATGWTECEAVWGRTHRRVATAVHLIRQRLPVPLRELHTDNGGEFLNQILVPWCRYAGIRLTRGRPYRKNDQAYAEQKVWAQVRRIIGYDRYTTQLAYTHLSRLYPALTLYTNFFQPLRKLRHKHRLPSRVIKQFEVARTPYRRLLDSGALAPSAARTLADLYQSLNPLALRRTIEETLTSLWKCADRSVG